MSGTMPKKTVCVINGGLNQQLPRIQSSMRCCAPVSSSSAHNSVANGGRKRHRTGDGKKHGGACQQETQDTKHRHERFLRAYHKDVLDRLTSEDTCDRYYLDVHAKCQLEVHDPKHRYGKFLRAYHKEWNRMGQPQEDFFTWLEGASAELQHVPFSSLNAETVRYIEGVTAQNEHLLNFIHGRLYRHSTGEPVNTEKTGWIFVLENNKLYASKKITDTQPRFHHTSFLNGARVQMAGIFMASDGYIHAVYPHSGHYRPRETNLLLLLLFLVDNGCDLSQVEVDMQRAMRLNRDSTSFCVGEDGGAPVSIKQPKMKCAHMWNGNEALDFLLVLRSWSKSGVNNAIRSRTGSGGALLAT